jgi:hypothetical protein
MRAYPQGEAEMIQLDDSTGDAHKLFVRTHKLRDVYVLVLFIDEKDGGAYRQEIVGVFAEEDFAQEEKSRLIGVLRETTQKLHEVYVSSFERIWQKKKDGEGIASEELKDAELVWKLARKEILSPFPEGWSHVEIIDVVKSYLVEKAVYSRTVPLADEKESSS